MVTVIKRDKKPKLPIIPPWLILILSVALIAIGVYGWIALYFAQASE